MKHADLKEGMYLDVKLNAKEATNATSLSRNLVQENNTIYIVKEGVLALAPIKPVHFSETEIIFQGLNNGDLLVTKNIPEAYAGMPVKTIEDNTIQN